MCKKVSVRYCQCGAMHMKVGPITLDLPVETARILHRVLSKALAQFDSQPKAVMWSAPPSPATH